MAEEIGLSYADVPKDIEGNLVFREWVTAQCKEPAFLSAIKRLCKDSLLFWLNTFGWTYDPRLVERGQDPVTPWITWDFQDEGFGVLEENLGRRDLCVVKSRCMGWTWMPLAVITHRWQWYQSMAFGVVSREERMVDGHPRSLFVKIDFLLEHQPKFLLPNYVHFHMRFMNNDRKGTIEGATTGPNVFRGDRYTATFHDELAARDLDDGLGELKASHAATRARIFVSTPQGGIGAFYDVAHNPAIARYDCHWTRHPEYRVGMTYTGDRAGVFAEGRIVYPQGKPTSPWYEGECKRLNADYAIAQELDLDFGGSGKPYFHPETIKDHIDKHAYPPFKRGILEYAVEGDPKTIRFVEQEDGWLKLWVHLDGNRAKKGERFGAGADIATGVGATPSTMSVGRIMDREKVAEVANSKADPKQFARIVRMVCYVFNDPFLIWELAGPGVGFGKAILESGYTNVYYRRDEVGELGRIQSSYTAGWVPTPQNKELVLGNYRAALADESFINHSEPALKECAQYTYGEDGQVENERVRGTDGDARQNHGDRVIADALCNKAMGEPPVPMIVEGEVGLPEDSNILIPGHPLHNTQWAAMLEDREKEKDDEWTEPRRSPEWKEPSRIRRMEW